MKMKPTEIGCGAYLEKRSYRKSWLHKMEGRLLAELMERGFAKGFKSYWEQFGYEIGGPVCCGYCRWLADEIENNHPEITDIAFVARDGWLLKKAYALLPHARELKTHYVYAPRILAQQCREETARKAYIDYMDSLGLGTGKIAVVDTATVEFSSQRLLESAAPGRTYGVFWTATKGSAASHGLRFSTFQKKGISVVRCWDIIEFILSSPEPPVMTLDADKPVFKDAQGFEKEREAIFPEIEAGALRFAEELREMGTFPVWDCALITGWVNDFLKHPSTEDVTAFEGVRVSARVDHSDSLPLDPFAKKGLSARELKNRLWLFSTGHPLLYRALHNGNALRRRIVAGIRGDTREQYRGGDPEGLAERLGDYELVSFDVFDTLIFRPYEKSTDLFAAMEKENGIRGFHDLRVRAEADARASTGKPNREIDVYDIYNKLAEQTHFDAREYAEREIAAEKSCCFANRDMLTVCRLLEKKGVRMIAVSDMYLPEKTVRELLDGCGYGMVSAVYVSCSRGIGKGDGELLRLARAQEGKSVRCVHVGDSLSADVQGGKRAGWDTVWYRQAKESSSKHEG
jgi:HAD superfamily hydrolase (TIGR01549 family)